MNMENVNELQSRILTIADKLDLQSRTYKSIAADMKKGDTDEAVVKWFSILATEGAIGVGIVHEAILSGLTLMLLPKE